MQLAWKASLFSGGDMQSWMFVGHLWLVASIVLGLATTSFAQAPVDPTIVRINGTTTLTSKLLPAIAAQQKFGNASVSILSVGKGEFTVLGFGATWSTYLTDISLKANVAADSLSSAFKAAPANKAEIDTNYRFKDATLKFTFHVDTAPKTPYDGLVPTVVKQQTGIREAFFVTVNGFSGEFDLTMSKNGGNIEVDSVDKFNVQVDGVKVSDSARILELANTIASIGQFFGVPGENSVNDAATKLANELLKSHLEVREDLKKALNDSLKSVAQLGFGTQTIPIPQQGQLGVSGAFDAMQTSLGRAITQWSINVQGKPSGAVTNLPYTYLARPPQDVSQLAPQGDVELFIPYSLVDKTMYELIQMGSLGKITVPRSSTSGITVGFEMKVEPTEVPRANPVANQPGVISFEFGARMANTQVGTVNTGTFIPKSLDVPRNPVAPSTTPLKSDSPGTKNTVIKPVPAVPLTDPRRNLIPDSIPVMLTNGSARIAIQYALAATMAGGLNLRYMGLSISQLNGNLSAAGASVPLSQLSGPLQNAINAHIAKYLQTIVLINQAVKVVPGVTVQISQPRAGTRYIGMPLNLVAN